MTRALRVPAVVLAAGLALSACGFSGNGGGGGDGANQLSLLVPSYSDGTKQRWEQVIASFEKKHPDITVSLEVQSWDNINDVVRTKIQSGEAPDILNIDAFAGFAQDGLLHPAEEVASPETLADFQPTFVDNASMGGTMRAFPMIASTRTLFYNTDLLAQAGVAGPPKTWDELLDASKRISALGNGVHGYGMPLGNEEAQAETSIWTFGAGGSWSDGEKLTIDTPRNLEGVQAMQRMIEEDATQPDPGATDRTPLINVFIQGKIGMIEGLPPTIGQIEEKNPDLGWATAPIPTKDGSPVTLGVADHLMAFRNGGDKADAIRAFVDYFFSKDVYVPWVDAEGFLPTTKSGAEALSSKPELADFLAGLPEAQFYPGANRSWSAAQGSMQTLIGQLGQGKDPAAVLAEVQAGVEG